MAGEVMLIIITSRSVILVVGEVLIVNESKVIRDIETFVRS